MFRTLAHLITEEALAWSFRELRKDAAAGVDEVSVRDYEKNLSANLKDLHQRLRERRYQAQPLRRVYIEKEDGKQRPLSIPVLEDKVVQKATAEILTAIYEQDFLPCSYGYRPRRSAHDAIEVIQRQIKRGLLRWGQWCQKNRHLRLQEQRERLRVVLQGYYQYYGLPMNYQSLQLFYRGTKNLWRKWLGRRDRSTVMTWRKFNEILQRYPLPDPRLRREPRWNQLVLYGEFA